MEQLAAISDISVDTVRYYQSRGLLPPPEREGRVAWYGPEHVERIAQIRSLQRKGLTLAAIRRVVIGRARPGRRRPRGRRAPRARTESGEPGDRAPGPGRVLGAQRRAGIVDPGGGTRGHPARAGPSTARSATPPPTSSWSARRCGCLEFGLPLATCWRWPAMPTPAMRGLAERAVDLFDEHVRKPIRDTAGDDAAAAEQMVDAFRELLPAVTDAGLAPLPPRAARDRRRPHRGPRRGVSAVSSELPQGEDKRREVRAVVRHDLAALRPGEPGDDVRHGRRMASPCGARRSGCRAARWSLDLACGTGDLCRELDRRGYRAVGFDFSHGMLVNARTDVAARRGRHPAAAAGRRIDRRGHVRVRAAQRGLARASSSPSSRAWCVRAGASPCSTRAGPTTRVMRAGHSVYFNRAVPMIGGLISDRDAYAYLPKSMAYLPAPDEMVRMLAERRVPRRRRARSSPAGSRNSSPGRAGDRRGRPASGFDARSSRRPSTCWRPAPATGTGPRSCSSVKVSVVASPSDVGGAVRTRSRDACRARRHGSRDAAPLRRARRGRSRTARGRGRSRSANAADAWMRVPMRLVRRADDPASPG